jgi:hypothetical protein
MELPIACTLGPNELRGRLEDWEALAAGALRERRAMDRGVRLTYEPGGEAELHRLVELETTCCAWAQWEVRRDGEVLVLDVTADDAAAVRAMFGA